MPKVISDELYARLVKMAEAHITDEAESYERYDDAVTCGNFDDCYNAGSEQAYSALAHEIVEDVEMCEQIALSDAIISEVIAEESTDAK